MPLSLPGRIGRLTEAVLLVALSAWAAPSPPEPAAAELGRGVTLYTAGNYTGAIPHLRAAGRVAKLADYAVYYLASAEQRSNDIDGALSALTAYRSKPVASSPLAGKISLLYGRVLLDKHEPAASGKALEALQADYKLLPQPDGDFALGMAYESLGEGQQAALAYQRAYYEHPNTDLAEQSAVALERLRTALGKDFPEPSSRRQLDRCEKWIAAKNYAKARAEYLALAESLPDPERDEAKVGVGVADYLAGDATAAYRYLKELRLARAELRAERAGTVLNEAMPDSEGGKLPEPEAERLYYLAEAARRISDDAASVDALHELDEKHAQSAWRLKALVSAGNHFLLTNERARYAPLFRAAFESFAAESLAAYAHWRITWDAYLTDSMDAPAFLREQIDRYPGESHSGTALYYLGRAAERAGKLEEARACYERLNIQFPHYFYGVLARQRLASPKISAAVPDAVLAASLAAVDWPARRDLTATVANPATRERIERTRLLSQAGLPDAVEAEIRFGAKTGSEQPQLLALELAHSAPSPFRALRVMKSFSGDYLSLPTSAVSSAFWQMLFPLPYRDYVFGNARARNLDPFYVAALIRQESEFNPGAHSAANAYGLMQLIPSTGRLMGRKIGLRSVGTASLLNPLINIKLGTEYLRGQLVNWNGDWYQTLAAYNAGPTHVREWNAWASYREPAEFIESIPFTETREYVQAVLRNADMYRELYADKPLPRPNPPAVVKTAKAVKPAKKAEVPPNKHLGG